MVSSAFSPPPTLEIWQLKALLFPQKAFHNLQALLFFVTKWQKFATQKTPGWGW
jgi:hypothetical protein